MPIAKAAAERLPAAWLLRLPRGGLGKFVCTPQCACRMPPGMGGFLSEDRGAPQGSEVLAKSKMAAIDRIRHDGPKRHRQRLRPLDELDRNGRCGAEGAIRWALRKPMRW